jgi:hypothetical protein
MGDEDACGDELEDLEDDRKTIAQDMPIFALI